MDLNIVEESARDLREYAKVPIAFEVQTIFEMRASGEGYDFAEVAVAPYVKDYDALEPPQSWGTRWDLSNWGVLVGYVDGQRVAGALVARDTVGVDMLEGRKDLAVLWDLRVAAEQRGKGFGRQMVAAAEDWARAKGCVEMKVETQNINVPAYRCYTACGFELSSVNPEAYPELLGEVQLILRKSLEAGR